MGLLINNDGTMTLSALSGFLIMLGIPVLYTRWKLGVILIVLGFLAAPSQAMGEQRELNRDEDHLRDMTASAEKKAKKAARQLNDAILANSPTLVKQALDSRADPSVGLDNVPPICVAVQNCRNYQDGASLTIIDSLLTAGSTASDRTDALKLAISLKKKSGYSMWALEDAIKKLTAQPLGCASIPKIPVSRVAAQTWKRLLFSQDFSDVVFVFPDGSKLHAHRCVLAVASPYFDRYFKGPWAEHHQDGIWNTSNSVAVMKAVLTFIYTGELDTCILESDPADMLSVTDQYELRELHELTENSCIQNLSLVTVKPLLQMAHLHNGQNLKKACFDYVRRNAAKLLLDPLFTSLQEEDPNLWSELVSAIGG